MDYKIYCIEDINGLKYVGSTKMILKKRFHCHKTPSNKCSSKMLDLDNSKISLLELCDKKTKKIKEQYWIEKIDCVNLLKFETLLKILIIK